MLISLTKTSVSIMHKFLCPNSACMGESEVVLEFPCITGDADGIEKALAIVNPSNFSQIDMMKLEVSKSESEENFLIKISADSVQGIQRFLARHPSFREIFCQYLTATEFID